MSSVKRFSGGMVGVKCRSADPKYDMYDSSLYVMWCCALCGVKSGVGCWMLRAQVACVRCVLVCVLRVACCVLA